MIRHENEAALIVPAVAVPPFPEDGASCKWIAGVLSLQPRRDENSSGDILSP